MKTFNNIEEFNQYVDKDGNFFYDGDIELNFHLTFKGNISAGDINAWDINARDISAWDIDACDINARDISAADINATNISAGDINAGDISYHALCIAYHSLKCKSITGRYKNSIHKCLNNEIEIISDK